MNRARVPAQIGPYAVERLIARGGMGAVYLGRHPQLGYEVAIKVLLAGRKATDGQRRRFRREIEALSKLQHPGLVKVLEAGEEDGAPWFSMQRVEGTSLEGRLEREGPLPIEAVVELATQLCAALSTAHGVGILHRDLKPDNVLCMPMDRFVVTDFGLAKDLEVEQSVRLSRTGALQGTPCYWSPEQARGLGGKATVATDVYGLGATLYAALTGKPPIGGDTWIEVLVATREQPPAPPRTLRPEVPDWLERVVLRCLAKDPEDRYPSMSALRAGLEAKATEPAAIEEDTVPHRLLLPGAVLGAFTLSLSLVLAWNLFPASSESARPDEAARIARPEEERSLTATEESAKRLLARANAFYESGQPEEALVSYRGAAELGEPEAMRKLGELLVEGRGVERNDAEAVQWFRRAAELGAPEAMAPLGFMLIAGRGVEKNETEGTRWFQRAADLGDLHGMRNLGVSLLSGKGVERNEAEAERWFRRAAELGHAGAMGSLGNMLLRGKGVEKNEAEAVRWFRRAAELGEPESMAFLGSMLANGEGIEKDPAEALRWFRRGAAANEPKSMVGLGLMYFNGAGVEKNETEAARWWRRSAELGDPQGMNYLASTFATGQGSEKNETEAARWLRRAAERADPESMFNLGVALVNGQGVKKDEAEAAKWFRRVLQSPGGTPDLREDAAKALRGLGQEP